MSRWPIHSCNVRMATPAPAQRVPNVCRRSWMRWPRRAWVLERLAEPPVVRASKSGSRGTGLRTPGRRRRATRTAGKPLELASDLRRHRDAAGRPAVAEVEEDTGESLTEIVEEREVGVRRYEVGDVIVH